MPGPSALLLIHTGAALRYGEPVPTVSADATRCRTRRCVLCGAVLAAGAGAWCPTHSTQDPDPARAVLDAQVMLHLAAAWPGGVDLVAATGAPAGAVSRSVARWRSRGVRVAGGDGSRYRLAGAKTQVADSPEEKPAT